MSRYVALRHGDQGLLVHATPAAGNYATLCGASDDDGPESGEPAEMPRRPKITCEDCRQLILHARTYTKADFSRRLEDCG